MVNGRGRYKLKLWVGEKLIKDSIIYHPFEVKSDLQSWFIEKNEKGEIITAEWTPPKYRWTIESDEDE